MGNYSNTTQPVQEDTTTQAVQEDYDEYLKDSTTQPDVSAVQEAESWLIVQGYVRKHYSPQVPYDIVHLINLFIDFIHHWYFSKAQLSALYANSKNGFTFKSKLYVESGITFQCKLNVLHKGWTWEASNDSGSPFIRYIVEIINIPSEIEEFGMYGELSCSKINSKYVFPLKSPHSVDSAYWSDNTLPLQELIKFHHISFDVYIDILYIVYKQNINKKNYFRKLEIPKCIEYEWQVPHIKLDENGIESEAFGNYTWDINLFDWNGLQLAPRLLKIPYGISCIQIKIRISSNKNITDIVKTCKYKLNGGGWVAVGGSTKIRNLYLKVKLEITTIYDKHNNEIPSVDWHKYGFI